MHPLTDWPGTRSVTVNSAAPPSSSDSSIVPVAKLFPAFSVRGDAFFPTGRESQGVGFRLRGIASKQAGQVVDQAKGTAQTEAERIKAAAREEVEREVNRVKEQLRKHVGELAVAGAAQILKREIDAKAHADVLKELAAKI